MRHLLLPAVVALGCIVAGSASAPSSIDSYGAIRNNGSLAAARANALALSRAFAANRNGGRVVVPADGVYTSFPAKFLNGANFEFSLEGTLVMPEDLIDDWPMDGSNYQNFLDFENFENLTIHGGGAVDGQGYWWWWLTIFNTLPGQRPNMFNIQNVTNLVVTDLECRNSPRYHFDMHDVMNVEVSHVSVEVNITLQSELYEKAGLKAETALTKTAIAAEQGASLPELQTILHSHLPALPTLKTLLQSHPPTHPKVQDILKDFPIPTFPLNTDGIDIAGKNIYVHDTFIRNFDDTVCVKPGQKARGWCSENYLAENNVVQFGVGATVGSVPSNPGVNCVRNITFRNYEFQYPIKTAYVKSNPPSDASNPGSALITDVWYKNVTAVGTPIWDQIYLGMQQQDQPNGGSGPGWWPQTSPYVTIKNVHFEDFTGPPGLWLWPGVFRRNVSNPSTNITLDNVHLSVFNASANYYCEYVHGTVTNSTPVPSCF